MTDSAKSITIAIAWCLAWGEKRKPQFDLSVLQQMREALNNGTEVPEEVRSLVEQVKQLQEIPEKYFPEKITDLRDKYPDLWKQTTRIGLVYGGATKIKQYVFESAKIQDIRGASALLERINSIDLPAFFGKVYKPELPKFKIYCGEVRRWLDRCLSMPQGFPYLSEALIPELIIYSTGGNILAFCPAAFVNDLTNAIERRYTEETLTANSCAVGNTFKLLEIRFGLLRNSLEETLWLDWYRQEYKKPLIQAYFGKLEKQQNELCNPAPESVEDAFADRKSFNELASKLAILFNQRRSGNDFHARPTRRYPPMFETHPYLVRDGSDRRSAVVIVQPPELPRESRFSEASARKQLVGERAKHGTPELRKWYENTQLEWQRGVLEGWTDKFKTFLKQNPQYHQNYYADTNPDQVQTAQRLTHVGNASKDFVAYIYADGNNFGGFIQKIRTPQKHKEFSEDTSKAIEYAVYQALAENLHPHTLKGMNDEDSTLRDGDIVHPFEIITIGGDDILLIVPANHALAITKTIGEQFEKILLKEVPLVDEQIKGKYWIDPPKQPVDISNCHRYRSKAAELSKCKLSLSIGVLITAYNTPIYYAEKLTGQLLKSAKERAKELREKGYCGGTVDFFTMKSVTMVSSSIKEFRDQALTKSIKGQTLKLYAAPYTLHELGGLLKTAEALKESKFPRSQLYQIRSLLEQGKHTAILNYRYFRVRLQPEQQKLLAEWFEKAWCQAKTNDGNLAPWMSILPKSASPKQPEQKSKKQSKKPSRPSGQETSSYETIWRELVELYPFIDESVTQLEKEVSQ